MRNNKTFVTKVNCVLYLSEALQQFIIHNKTS